MFRDTPKEKKNKQKTPNLRYYYLSYMLKCKEIAFHQKYLLSLPLLQAVLSIKILFENLDKHYIL